MSKRSIKSKTITGMLWSFTDLIFNQGIQFVMQIILARLLLPEDFGLIGMIAIFIALSQTLTNSGFSTALIREKEVSNDDYSTIFIFNMSIAIILYLILFFSADSISSYFDEIRLVNIIRILGLIIIIDASAMVQRTILAKRIDFKTQTKINLIATLFSGIIAIILALKGFGVWSLVIRNLVQQTLGVLFLIYFNQWLPSLVFKADTFKRMITFSWRLLASSLINTLYNNVYYVIIGRYFTAADLGYYTNGRKLSDTASKSLTTTIQRVTFPVLSSIQDDDVRLKAATVKIIKNTVFITFPVMAGLASIAKPMIQVLMGDVWLPSVLYFQIICLTGMLYPLHAINLNILQVKGRSDLFLKIEMIKKLFSTIAIVLVLVLKLSIIELLWIGVLNSIISFYINSFYSSKLIDYSIREQVRDIVPVVLTTAIMSISVFTLIKVVGDGTVLALVSGIAMGVATYLITCQLLKVDELNDSISMIRNHFIEAK